MPVDSPRRTLRSKSPTTYCCRRSRNWPSRANCQLDPRDPAGHEQGYSEYRDCHRSPGRVRPTLPGHVKVIERLMLFVGRQPGRSATGRRGKCGAWH
ncbi:hypothetical protein ACPA9J_29980 [Pseudomonas aeruginosa]